MSHDENQDFAERRHRFSLCLRTTSSGDGWRREAKATAPGLMVAPTCMRVAQLLVSRPFTAAADAMAAAHAASGAPNGAPLPNRGSTSCSPISVHLANSLMDRSFIDRSCCGLGLGARECRARSARVCGNAQQRAVFPEQSAHDADDAEFAGAVCGFTHALGRPAMMT